MFYAAPNPGYSLPRLQAKLATWREVSAGPVGLWIVHGAGMAPNAARRTLDELMVALLHAANLMRVKQFSGHIGMNRIFGYVGVDFFFVLSGFIITYVHYSEIGRSTSVLIMRLCAMPSLPRRRPS